MSRDIDLSRFVLVCFIFSQETGPQARGHGFEYIFRLPGLSLRLHALV